MKKSVILTCIIFMSTSGYVYAQMDDNMGDSLPGHADKGGMETKMEMAHAFPHPFFNHMGIPDMAGMVSTRISGYRQGHSNEKSTEDFGFHLEAGLYDRLGLHVRNNAIKDSSRTDVMLMYALLLDNEAESGISIFGGALIPSGTIPNGQDDVIGAFGISGRKIFNDLAIVDGQVHYMPEMEMFEVGLSGVFKATEKFFPILEIEGELRQKTTEFYLLPALKFKLKPEVFIGVGMQIALTSDKEFDTRTLLQMDMAW